MYRVEFADRGMSIQFARLAWRHYLAEGVDLNEIPTHEDQDAMTRPPRANISAAAADLNIPDAGSPDMSIDAVSTYMPSDEED